MKKIRHKIDHEYFLFDLKLFLVKEKYNVVNYFFHILIYKIEIKNLKIEKIILQIIIKMKTIKNASIIINILTLFIGFYFL
jgi:hypothetical protein